MIKTFVEIISQFNCANIKCAIFQNNYRIILEIYVKQFNTVLGFYQSYIDF